LNLETMKPGDLTEFTAMGLISGTTLSMIIVFLFSCVPDSSVPFLASWLPD